MTQGKPGSPAHEREHKNEHGEGKSRTHKKVVRVWDVATNSKEFHQVVKLAMYIAAYLP